MSDQRIHPASERRLRDAWAEGHIPVTRTLPSAVAWLTLGATLIACSQLMFSGWRQFAIGQWTRAALAPRQAWDPLPAPTPPLPLLSLAVPLTVALLAAAAAALVAGMLSNGFGLWPQRVQPDLSRCLRPPGPPGSRFPIWAFNAVRFVLGAAVAGTLLATQRGLLLELLPLPLPQALALIHQSLGTLAWQLGGILAALAGLDFALTRWHWQRSLRMTEQEFRDEQRLQDRGPRG